MNDLINKLAGNFGSELAAMGIRLAEAQSRVDELTKENGKLRNELAIRDKMKGGDKNGTKTPEDSNGQKPTA